MGMVRSLSFILVLMVIGCKCQEKSVTALNDSQNAQELTLIMQDLYGGAPSEELQVIRSEGELKKLFLQINKTRKPGLSVPRVDFDREMVLVYSAGKTRGSGIPELELTKSRSSGTIMASRKAGAAPDTEAATAAITTPFALYVMPATEKQVVLEK